MLAAAKNLGCRLQGSPSAGMYSNLIHTAMLGVRSHQDI